MLPIILVKPQTLCLIKTKNMKKIFNAIDNRMYCEYYKLHVIIQEFINKEVDDEILSNKITIRKKYPPYKNVKRGLYYGNNRSLV